MHGLITHSSMCIFFSLCVSSGCDAQLYMHFLVLRDVIILAEESCSSFYVPSVNPEMLEGGGWGKHPEFNASFLTVSKCFEESSQHLRTTPSRLLCRELSLSSVRSLLLFSSFILLLLLLLFSNFFPSFWVLYISVLSGWGTVIPLDALCFVLVSPSRLCVTSCVAVFRLN